MWQAVPDLGNLKNYIGIYKVNCVFCGGEMGFAIFQNLIPMQVD
jgi:hypothetical protein